MENSYEQTYQLLLPRLQSCDFEEAAQRVGFAPPENGTVSVRFLCRDYRISASGISEADGSPGDAIHRSLLIYYITSLGTGGPGKEFLPMGAFLPPLFRGGSDDLHWVTQLLLDNWGQNEQTLNQPFQALGTDPPVRIKDGCFSWDYRILPKVSVRVVYYQADAEFPAELRFLLDDHAGAYFEFEQMAFLSGAFFKAALDAVK